MTSPRNDGGAPGAGEPGSGTDRLAGGAGAARDGIRELYRARSRGDIPERSFDRTQAEAVVDLCRAVARERLAGNETIRAEHHVVHAHTNMNQSILREVDQECVSLFLTSARLLRLRFLLAPGRPPSCDGNDGACWDELDLARITGLRTRRAFRRGEATAGAAIFAAALVFQPWLQVTGALMAVLGALGFFHAFLMPSRWIEVETANPSGIGSALRIDAVRKKSARTMIEMLKNTAHCP